MPTHTTHHDPLVAIVAGQVRAIMGRKRITQKDLAGILGLSQPAISSRLRIDPDTPFSLDDIWKLSAALDVPPSYFVTDGAEAR